MTEIQHIKELLKIPQTVSIVSHRNPDGDAIGSSLALRLYLEKQGHLVNVILPSESPKVFGFLTKASETLIYDLDTDRCNRVIDSSKVIFFLDFNAFDRIDKLGDYIAKCDAKTIMIDHHLFPEPIADHIISRPEASSTCEMIYDFLKEYDNVKQMDLEIGECIFTGMITDTGCFKYATNKNTYVVAAALKEIGVDDYSLNDRIFNTLTEKQLRLMGHCLANRMELIPEYQTGIVSLTKQDYADFDIGRGDTEGIVNQILTLDGIKVAAFIREQPTIVKLSLRSKGDISVNEIAANHFNGGGHKNAAGGAAYAKLEDIISRFKQVLPNYLEKTSQQ